MYANSSGRSAWPFPMPCHFARQPRQQVAVACCATKYRMSLEGGLFAVIPRVWRPQPLHQEVGRIGEHGLHTFSFKVSQFSRAQPEAPRNGDLPRSWKS
jgi:hypothetical protein